MDLKKQPRVRDRDLMDSFHEKGCVACGKRGSDPAHVRSRGSGGDDVADNLVPLCREHHTIQHAIGWSRFVERFPTVGLDLVVKGWAITADGRLARR